MSCSICKFFVQTKADKGICKRYPPFKWFVGGKWAQPEVHTYDWCGEGEYDEMRKYK
jgi:hypothetical protein